VLAAVLAVVVVTVLAVVVSVTVLLLGGTAPEPARPATRKAPRAEWPGAP
jgi:hypothetical protein